MNQFTLERVGSTAAIYDITKLTWMHAHYLNEEDLDRIVELVIPYFQRKYLISEDPSQEEMDYLRKVVEAVRTRVKTLAEVADAAEYFYVDDFSYDEKGVRKHFRKENAAEYLAKAREKLATLADFTLETTETAYRDLSEELGIKAGKSFIPPDSPFPAGPWDQGFLISWLSWGKRKPLSEWNGQCSISKISLDGAILFAYTI